MTPPDSDFERIFLENLPIIEQIIAIQVRRHALQRSDAEDYASWAKAKLIADDYAVLRKFAGRSSMSTFLTSVLANLYCDYRNSQWGRWRPSALAVRRGPVAIRLEELLYRDGHDLRTATEILRTTNPSLSVAEIARLAAALPARARVPEIPLDDVLGTGAEPASHDAGWERQELVQAISAVVRKLVDELPPEDALIIRLKYWEDLSVADIARTLRLDQKALYRRLPALEERLIKELEKRGFGRDDWRDLFGGPE